MTTARMPQRAQGTIQYWKNLEEKGDKELAKATYQQLIDEFGTQESTPSSLSRVVVL